MAKNDIGDPNGMKWNELWLAIQKMNLQPNPNYFFNCIAYGSNATRSPAPKPKSKRNLRVRVLNGVG